VIRIGVIGAGELPEAHAAAFEAAGCPVRVGGEELLAGSVVDAAVIASEPERRFHHTALALENGLDVLVEQPVAPTVENARMLERIATLRPMQPVLQISQPDHFNAALRTLAGRTLLAIDFRRHGSGLDAMLHDIHNVTALARSPLVRLQASGHASYAVVTLVFESGLIGTLAVGEAGPGPGCRVVATTADSEIAVDAVTGVVEIARGASSERTQSETGDPLVAQAESFLDAVSERRRPEVGIRTAIACQEVADKVRECLAVQAASAGVPTS
jgi:predicted dehydrogenase